MVVTTNSQMDDFIKASQQPNLYSANNTQTITKSTTSAPTTPTTPGFSNPAGSWNNGQTPASNWGDYSSYNPTYTAKYKNGLQAAQEKWYYQFLDAYKQGKANMGDLDRFHGYQNVLGLQGNKTYGGGANIQEAQKDFARQYADKLKNGVADLSEFDQYMGYVNAFGLDRGTPSQSVLQQLSAQALNGNKTAQDYLNRVGAKNLSGIDLWKDFDTNTLQKNSEAYNQYMKDIPYSQFTKDEEKKLFDIYQEHIQSGKMLDGGMLQKYKELASKWNLEDMTDPHVRQRDQLEKDKKAAMDAQDIALNQGLAQMDTNSFNQFNQLQQQMSERGMGDSGIAADAYMRAQMANNQNYQQAYAQGATTKSNIQTQFNEAISNSRLQEFDYKNKLQQAQAEQNIKLQEIQNDQDKWLTESTGSVFVNGQRIMVDGKPLTTVEWEKLSEEKRSNLAQEALEGQKNAWDYQIGQEKNALGWDSNAIKRQQVAVDLQIATSKMQLDYAKLDYNYAKLDANNAIAQEKIRVASDNAQTAADKSKISALGQQLDSITKQLTAYQKSGKNLKTDQYKALVDEYNRVLNDLNSVAGNFQVGSGGAM